MKPSARINAGLEIWSAIHAAPVPMDAVIGDYMRSRRYVGSKDRAAIVQRTYNMMRHYARLGWWLEEAGAEDNSRTRMIAWLVRGEGADVKRVQGLFDGSQYAPISLSDDEEKLCKLFINKDINDLRMPEHVRAECPPKHAETLQALWGGDFAKQMQAMLQEATLDLRVNRFLIDREGAAKSLAKDKIATDPTPYAPQGLRCQGKAYLAKSKAFHKGWIAIQDEGSQLIASLCEAKPGMQVLDYCAGGGGKTLALAADMQRKGRIVAMDTDARRLEKGRQRYKKAQLADIIELRPLVEEKNRKWLRRQKGSFDVVLTDVPCSGSGTWRRNPDSRWFQHGPPLEELLPIQAEILDKVAPCVKPGGRLVYATCSLFPAENEDQVEAFLARHPDFTLIPPTNPELGTPYMRLSPLTHSTDGFFAAVLQRATLPE